MATSFISGITVLTSGDLNFTITHSAGHTNYQVSGSKNWVGGWFYITKTNTQIIINFATVTPSGGEFAWTLVES